MPQFWFRFSASGYEISVGRLSYKLVSCTMSSKSAPGCFYSQVADCSAFVEQWASRCETYV